MKSLILEYFYTTGLVVGGVIAFILLMTLFFSKGVVFKNRKRKKNGPQVPDRLKRTPIETLADLSSAELERKRVQQGHKANEFSLYDTLESLFIDNNFNDRIDRDH